MKKPTILNSKGFTLVEMVIASGIMVVVVFGAYQAYTHFNKQTITEAKKLDDISEFNALTKDLLSFTEGAGVSTFYLNLPIKTKNCNAEEPCVRQLNEQSFVAPTVALPQALQDNECVQFYKDATGSVDSKLAFPGRPRYRDLIWEARDVEMSGQSELYATWLLKDDTSPPFMMVKSRDASTYLTLINTPYTLATSMPPHGDPSLTHALFSTSSSKDGLLKLKGYPFLIYNSTYTNHYTIKHAEEIIACADRRSECISIFKSFKSFPFLLPTSDPFMSTYLGTNFPSNVYAIKFSPTDYQGRFFSDIVSRQNLPAICKAEWGQGKQSSAGTFFPTNVTSLSKGDSTSSSELDLDILNPVFLPKYNVGKEISGTTYVAMPIDLVTFRVERASDQKTLQLVSELWHPTEIKKKVKIHNLKAPFIISRKLGSPEMGIWYNPLKTTQK